MPSDPDNLQSANAPLRNKLYGKEKPFLQYPEDSAPLGMLLCAVNIALSWYIDVLEQS